MMDKFKRGKRADVGVYDDAWIKGDDAVEMVVPSPSPPPKLLHDKAIEEKYKKVIDEWNSLGFTSFTIPSEQIKSLVSNKDGD